MFSVSQNSQSWWDPEYKPRHRSGEGATLSKCFGLLVPLAVIWKLSPGKYVQANFLRYQLGSWQHIWKHTKSISKKKATNTRLLGLINSGCSGLQRTFGSDTPFHISLMPTSYKALNYTDSKGSMGGVCISFAGIRYHVRACPGLKINA